MTQQRRIPQYWRSLDQLEDSPEFRDFVQREFPVAAAEFPPGVSRRRWLQLMGASFALAGAAGCRWETERIAPFAERPESRIPGEPQKYATSIEWAGRVRHLLVACIDGRPIKIEGNPDHPGSGGAADAVSQACILDLYDPDRRAVVKQVDGRQTFNRTWDEFQVWAKQHFSDLANEAGRGLAVLFELTTSPSVHATLRMLRDRFPEVRLYEDASSAVLNERAGSQLAFNRRLATQYDLAKAKVIVCLDADLLGAYRDSLRHARDFAERRDPDGPWMNRLYAIESQVSVTGGTADHRLALPSRDVASVLTILERQVRGRLDDASSPESTIASPVKRFLHGVPEARLPRVARFIDAIVDDLIAHRQACIVAAGPCQPQEVHARVHALNNLLGNVGETVVYRQDPTEGPVAGSVGDLVGDIAAGSVESLLILDANPVFTALGDLDIAAAIERVPHTICLSRYEDETARICRWRLPLAHPLESWGDVRSSDGTLSVSQPLIEPLLSGKSILEVLAMVAGDERESQDIVRSTLADLQILPLTDAWWRRILHDGLQQNSAFEAVTPRLLELRRDAAANLSGETDPPAGLELVFTVSHATFDGRLANNGWLQETPDPITKLTWDNAAIFAPGTAKRLGVRHGTLVDLRHQGRRLRVAAFVLPGQAEDSIGLSLGYGRRAAGRVGGSDALKVPPVGVNANVLRTGPSSLIAQGVQVTPTGISYDLATTQDHHAIDTLAREEIGQRVGELVREAPLGEYRQHPDFAAHQVHHPALDSLWQEPSYDGYAWGMSIDLNKCIGCNACVVACQAENNVPIVGKEQVLRGREMHWIRVDRYFSGDVDEPSIVHQPVTCHHCENAPCEQVCPVAATVHSDEGLNDMIYNRCIGTRYCANNCPYKVRRFNFFDYNQQLEQPAGELVQLGVNPEVTVRSRGVMEKCTYCVQRIQRAKIDAKNEGRPVRDGEIVTACQQACPARAIEFGDLNDPGSRVAKAHANPRAYGMLAELNVKPRTKYLARVRNPHPLLVDAEARGDDHDHAY